MTFSIPWSPARVSRTSYAPTSLESRLHITAYSTTFAPRRVGVVGSSRRTIVDVERAKDEKLEVGLARKLEYLAARR